MRHSYAVVGIAVLLARPETAIADSISITRDNRQMAVLAAAESDRHTDHTQPPSDSMRTAVSATHGTSSASAATTLLSSIADPAHLSGKGTAAGQASLTGNGS